jgi:predicted nucleic acid-binding protein
VIGADTSLIVRYLVGTPTAAAARAARVINGKDLIGLSLVALFECAHVLRTQYGVDQADIIHSLIELLLRENIVLLGMRNETAVDALVQARGLPGRPLPDALIVAASREAGATPILTFDRSMKAYGYPVREPA